MLYFLSYVYYKRLKSKGDFQPHSRSLAIMPFDRSYVISYYSFIVTTSLSCTISGILSIIFQYLEVTLRVTVTTTT